jgi:cysteine-rich repeat protein
MLAYLLPLVVLLVTAAPASAARLFAPDTGARGRDTTTVQVDRALARDLATHRRRVVLDDVPLAGGGTATFAVTPIDVFTKDAEVVEFDGVHRRSLGRPDVAVYEGADVAAPERTLVLSIADGARVAAIVRDGQRVVSAIEPSADGDTHALADPTKAASGPVRNLCNNHLAPEGILSPHGDARSAARSAPPTDESPTPTLALEVLVDVGNDLYTSQFGSSAPTATQYVASLFGAVSGVYRRDIGVAVLVSQLVIWTTPDPFGGVDSHAQLVAYQNYNNANRVGVVRDTAHLLAHIGDGGIAYRGVLCDDPNSDAVSNLDGFYSSFPTVGFLWDVYVVSHELGHNFGSKHTHCYVPPLDHCYNLEPGCYNGPVEPTVGEMMSYCHLVDSIEMGFSPTVEAVVRAGAEAGVCVGLAPGVCGNGVIEPGETCDDGNVADGDCCAANCVAEVGLACTDDSDACTTDACSETGVCAHTPPGTCTPCQAATTVPAAGGMFMGTTSGASTVTSTCGGAGPEAVFNWTPTGSGVADLDACASNFNTVLHVHTGACEGGPQLTCNDDDGTCGPRSRLTFAVAPGTTYYVFVDGYGGAQGDFGLSVNLLPTPTCSASPLVGCKVPASKKSSFQLKDNGDDTKDQLAWKWGNGALTTMADLGSPTTTDFYQLCVYDTGGLKTSAVVTPGGSCTAGKPCWTMKPASFAYKNKSRTPEGIEKLDLKSNPVPGKAKLQMKGKGTLLAMPSLSGLVPPLRVQLVRTGGTCWEGVYSAPTVKPDGSQLSGKSD